MVVNKKPITVFKHTHSLLRIIVQFNNKKNYSYMAGNIDWYLIQAP